MKLRLNPFVVAVGFAIGLALSLAPLPSALASRNSAGTYTLPTGNPVNTGTTITTAWANSTLGDLGTEVTNSLDRSGRGGMLAPLALSNGSSSQPSLTFTSEPSTGFYRPGLNEVKLQINSSNVLDVLSTGLFVAGTVAGQPTGNAIGVSGIGSGTGDGVQGSGATTGYGGSFFGGGSNGIGAKGYGNGTAAGMAGIGGSTSGPGGNFTGGAPNGNGVQGTGVGNSFGVTGQGSGTGAGVRAVGGATGSSTRTTITDWAQGSGVYGSGGASASVGGVFAGGASYPGMISFGGGNSIGGVFFGGASTNFNPTFPANTAVAGYGFGSGAGMYGVGGATGIGGVFIGGSTSGAALQTQGGGLQVGTTGTPITAIYMLSGVSGFSAAVGTVAGTSVTATVTGATTSGKCFATSAMVQQYAVPRCYVSAANTVTVILYNGSASTQNFSALTVDVVVMQP